MAPRSRQPWAVALLPEPAIPLAALGSAQR